MGSDLWWSKLQLLRLLPNVMSLIASSAPSNCYLDEDNSSLQTTSVEFINTINCLTEQGPANEAPAGAFSPVKLWIPNLFLISNFPILTLTIWKSCSIWSQNSVGIWVIECTPSVSSFSCCSFHAGAIIEAVYRLTCVEVTGNKRIRIRMLTNWIVRSHWASVAMTFVRFCNISLRINIKIGTVSSNELQPQNKIAQWEWSWTICLAHVSWWVNQQDLFADAAETWITAYSGKNLTVFVG